MTFRQLPEVRYDQLSDDDRLFLRWMRRLGQTQYRSTGTFSTDPRWQDILASHHEPLHNLVYRIKPRD